MPRSTTSLLCALLKITHTGNHDIRRISVDSYQEESIYSAYSEIGLTKEEITLSAHPFHLLSSDYTEQIVDFHRNNIKTGRADFCLTGMQTVYDILTSEGIMATKVFATADVILQQIQRLYINHKTEEEKNNKMAVLSLQCKFSREGSIYGKSELHFFLCGTKVISGSYAFAQRIGAAVELSNNDSCTIYATSAAIETETSNFSTLPLINEIQRIEGVLRVHIGIGIGYLPADAKYHAELGKNRALTCARSSFFIVYEDHKIIGPVFPNPRQKPEILIDRSLHRVSEQTGIGLEMLHRLQRVIDLNGIETTTSSELASLCKITVNRMNRILVQLEKHGFLNVIGKSPPGERGRPRRLIKLLL